MDFCKRMVALLLAVAAFCAVLQPAVGFIRIEGGKFVDEDCNEFQWVGANMWRMLEAQITDEKALDTVFQEAAARNITVMRMFMTGIDTRLPVLVGPGEYNNVALEALDGVVAKAAEYNIRLTLILARNWEAQDGKNMFASWNGLDSPDDFFTSAAAQKDFQDYIKTMTQRVNSVTGVRYRDDPTIFSWNLMNEPRFFPNNTVCQSNAGDCTQAMQSWIEMMSQFLKSQDPNHLVAIGSEGFYGPDSSDVNDNPSDGDWAPQTGQDFYNNTSVDGIDYAVIHIWPDNWNVSVDFIGDWIDSHMAEARSLKKPLVIEEFGKNITSHSANEIATVRDPVFQTVFARLNQSIADGDVLKGAQYWMWDPLLSGPDSANWTQFGQDQVLLDESTMVDIIAPTAVAIRSSPVAGCEPATTTAASISKGGRKLKLV